MKILLRISIFCCLLLVSCSSGPSLEKYFLENTQNANFIVLEISPIILKVDKSKLSVEQNEVLQSFDKINLLAFKIDGTNKAQFEIERTKVVAILKDKKYQQFMKFGSGNEGASISYLGSEDHIEELVLFANKKDLGFAIVRVLGKDLNPNNFMTMISVLKSANVDLEQLKPLQQLIK
jgi:hypothetical protein